MENSSANGLWAGNASTHSSAEQPALSRVASNISFAQPSKQPRPSSSLAQSVVTPDNYAFALGLLIHWLPPRELARGCAGVACRRWRQIHREQALRFLVLTAGNCELLDTNWDSAASHGSIKQLIEAPATIRKIVSLSSQSLTLIIEHLDGLLLCYEDWMQLQLPNLERLVIDGPSFHEHSRGLPLYSVIDGLQLGLLLSRFNNTVTTLILRASLCDEDDNPHPIMAAIVASFPHLRVLDIPTVEHLLYPVPPMPLKLFISKGDISHTSPTWLSIARLESPDSAAQPAQSIDQCSAHQLMLHSLPLQSSSDVESTTTSPVPAVLNSLLPPARMYC